MLITVRVWCANAERLDELERNGTRTKELSGRALICCVPVRTSLARFVRDRRAAGDERVSVTTVNSHVYFSRDTDCDYHYARCASDFHFGIHSLRRITIFKISSLYCD
jgi:hypothetical protein